MSVEKVNKPLSISPLFIETGCSNCGSRINQFTPHKLFQLGSYRKSICLKCGYVTEDVLIGGEWTWKQDLQFL